MRMTGCEKGYTMLETIMYIGILGMLGAVLASTASDVFGRYKTGRITQQILDLQKAIIAYTAANEDYSELNANRMQTDRALPLDMRDLRHALGGRIEFGPIGDGSVDSNDKYLFYITFETTPQKSCIEILSQGQFYGHGSGMDALIVNGETSWSYELSFYDTSSIGTRHQMSASAGESAGFRPTVDQLLRACNRKDNNIITWIFS